MTHKDLKNMSNRIKERRKHLKYTQESFSEVIGISYGSYTKIENAFQKPALDTLIKIAHHLELSLDYIVFGSEERKPKNILDSDIINALIECADDEELLRVGELLIKIARVKNN